MYPVGDGANRVRTVPLGIFASSSSNQVISIGKAPKLSIVLLGNILKFAREIVKVYRGNSCTEGVVVVR